MNKILDISINFVKDILEDDITSLASEMAFSLITTISPFVIVLVAIFGIFSSDNIIIQIIDFLSPVTPPDALSLLEKALRSINRTSSGGLLTFGFLGTLWSVTGITDVIIKGLNRAYKVDETRPIWITKGFAIFLVLINVLVIFISTNIVIFTSIILDIVNRHIYVPHYIQLIILYSRWPVTFLALFFVMLVIYAFMPNTKDKWKIRTLSSIPGTLFFCIFWAAASWGFGIYAENYGGFNQVYGALGAFIILITWLYYTSIILFIGGEINSEIYKYFASKASNVQSKLAS